MGRSAGRAGRRWLRLRNIVKARRGPCCRCGKPIDYTLAYPHPDSFSVDHYPYPLKTHPHLAEDLGNLAAAHLVCNQRAGDGGQRGPRRRPLPPLGPASEAW